MKFKKIYIEITNKCNKTCSFCSEIQKRTKEMSIEEFKIVISKIKKHTDYIYLHVKGEPLIHTHFEEILEICEQNNMKINITTNGTLLDKRKKELKKYKCVRQINISLHSFEDDNESMQIEKILINTKQMNMQTNIIFVYRLWNIKNEKLSDKNKRIINKIIKIHNISANNIEKIYKTNNYKINNNLYLNKEKVFDWPSLGLNNNDSRGFCYGLKSHIAILSDGTVVPCCLDSNGIIDLGNIFEENLEKILEKERTKKIINGFKSRTIVEELCKKCTYKNRFNK